MSCTADFDSGFQMRWSPRTRVDNANDTDAKTRWYTDLTDGDGSPRIDQSKSVTIRLIRVPLGHSRLIINSSQVDYPFYRGILIAVVLGRKKSKRRSLKKGHISA